MVDTGLLPVLPPLAKEGGQSITFDKDINSHVEHYIFFRFSSFS